MNKEELFNNIKNEIDELNQMINNSNELGKEEFNKYIEIHQMFNDLDKLIEKQNDKYIDFKMKYLNCMGMFQEKQLTDFINVYNEVRSLLDDPKILEEKHEEEKLENSIIQPDYYIPCEKPINATFDCSAFRASISNIFTANIIIYQVSINEAFPYGNNDAVRYLTVNKLQPNQLFIQAGFGTTNKNHYNYVFNLVRQGFWGENVVYSFDLQLHINNQVLNIKGLFNEMASVRDGDILKKELESGKDVNTINKNEVVFRAVQESEDVNYPNDALSEVRRYIKFIVENN